jgi:hypothetical protein
MKSLANLGGACALLALSQPAIAAEPMAKSGSAKLTAVVVCRSLGRVDMDAAGSQSSAECMGIVRSADGAKPLDNMGIRCLEEQRARADGYRFFGTCVQTDADGDKLFMTYEGPESGPVAWIGGSGKYKGVAASGEWTVADAPGNTASVFAFTLSYTANWTLK